MSEEELLYETIYSMTEGYERTQFVKALQKKDIKIKQLQEKVYKLQDENKSLKNENILLRKLVDKQKVVDDFKESLNNYKCFNILNELESWLEEQINTIEGTYSQINGNYMRMQPILDTYKETLDKLKKLKGDL